METQNHQGCAYLMNRGDTDTRLYYILIGNAN